MKGYWHFPAIAVVSSILTIIFSNWFIVGFLVWLLLLYFNQRLGRIPILASLTLYLFFYFYIPSIDTTEQIISTNHLTQTNQFSGKIVGTINRTPKKVDFVIQDNASKKKLLIVFFKNQDEKISEQQFTSLKHGAKCEVTGKTELPDGSTNPGQFSYRNYLLSKGITHQILINSLEDVTCSGSSSIHKIYSIRANMINHIMENVSPKTAAWLNALVLGDDSLIDEATIELFQRWSLSHLIAISGLNIGIIIALIYFLLVKLNILTKEKAQWLMILFLPFYALLAGGDPSVWRACTMVMFFISLNKLKLQYSVTDVLSIVFLLLIISNKYIVYSIGFQFSFLVTFGLLLSKKWFIQTKSPVFLVLHISFVSQMIILPIQVAYFYTFQPLSVLLNVVVVPYFSFFVMPLMFILFLFFPVHGFFTRVIDTLFINVHDVFISVIQAVDQALYYPWIIGSLSVGGSMLYFALFFYLMKHIQDNKLYLAFRYGCFIVVLIIGITLRPYFSPVGSVTMLDVGQGDAFIVELPYRKAVIFIDAGATYSFEDNQPTDKNYKQIIKPYLNSRGITGINAIFLSHEDTDHIGSVPYIIKEIDVEKIITSNYFQFDNQMTVQLQRKGIEIERAHYNEKIAVEGQPFYVLSPNSNKASTNENSLVLYSQLGGQKWLFTGDIGKETEKDLLTAYPNLKVDILKVAHHGSDTSTDEKFLDQIEPNYALISVGKENSYGHPSRDVLTVLEERGVFIFRTDLNGAIRFQFNNNQGTFLRYLP